MLQVLNRDSHVHSNRYSKMIDIYKGDKENRDCIERIFGNLINDIQDTCENIKSLLILRGHEICPNSASICSSRRVQSTDKELFVCMRCISILGSQCPSEITRLNYNNVYLSNSCKLCRNIELVQILHKIFNQMLISTDMTLQKIKTMIVNLVSVY